MPMWNTTSVLTREERAGCSGREVDGGKGDTALMAANMLLQREYWRLTGRKPSRLRGQTGDNRWSIS